MLNLFRKKLTIFIILCFIIVLALLIIRWGSDCCIRLDETQNCQNFVLLTCNANVHFEITNVTLGSNAQITVISNGNQNIDSFSWNIIDSTGVVKGSGTTTSGLVAYGMETFPTTTTTVIGDKVRMTASITHKTPKGNTCSENCTQAEKGYTIVQ